MVPDLCRIAFEQVLRSARCQQAATATVIRFADSVSRSGPRGQWQPAFWQIYGLTPLMLVLVD